MHIINGEPPEAGDIVLSSAAGILSKPIQWFAGKPTHAELYLGKIGGVDLMLGAGPMWAFISQVRVAPLSRCEEYQIVRAEGIDTLQRQKIVEFAMKQIGKWYSYTLLPLLAFRIKTGLLKENIDDPFPSTYVCSELVAYAYREVGFDFGYEPVNTLPKHIAQNEKVYVVAQS